MRKKLVVARGLGLTLICLLLLSSNTLAQKAAPDRLAVIDAIVKQEIEAGHFYGAVVLVGHDGKIVYRKAFGERAIEPAREAMTVDTIFDMASLTKPMATAMSVMMLFEEGQIRLDEAVAHYIPEFGANGKEQITVRQLLTHYSGLRPDLDLSTPWQGYGEAMKRIWEEKPVNPPGSRFAYSDINYEVLGELVARVSKMPLNEYAETHIFQPLGMTHTRFLPPKEWLPKIAPTQYADEQISTPVGKALPLLAQHVVKRGVVHDPTADRMGGVAGHAGLFSCADDAAKLAQSLIDRESVITPLTIDKMTTPQNPPNQPQLRGLGWDIDTSYSTNRGALLPVGSYGHTGYTGTSLWIDPTTNTYIVILTNKSHPHDKGNAIPVRSKIATAVAAKLALEPSEAEKARLASITGYSELMAGYRRIPARNGAVLNGIDVLQRDFGKYTGAASGKVLNVGVVTDQSGLDLEGRRTIDILAHAPGLKLAAIFSPEHGITGTLDTTAIGNSVDHATGVTVYSVYGDTPAKRHPPLDVVRQLDVIFYDIQDAGARFYTYTTTMRHFLEAAAATGAELIVLDRPNPITGSLVQGPVSDAGDQGPNGSCSAETEPPEKRAGVRAACPFADPFAEPIRPGMTMGELAQMFNAGRHINARLVVVPMQGWQRGDWFDSTSQVWVNPSPNLRNLTQATLYTGVAVIEGTNVSVGRDTDTPFELVGAPWINPRELAQYLNARLIAGVRFVPITFTPAPTGIASVDAAHHGGKLCGGVSLVITDRSILDAPEMGLEIASALRKLYPNDWKHEKLIYLLGNRAVYDALVAGVDPRRIAAGYEADLQKFIEMRKQYLIYK